MIPVNANFVGARAGNHTREFCMRNLFKLLGIIALVAVIGFTMVGCKTDEDGDSGGGGSNSDIIGTWSGTISDHGNNYPFTLVIGDGTYAITVPNFSALNDSGTYTRNGNTAALTSKDRDTNGIVIGTATVVDSNTVTVTLTAGPIAGTTVTAHKN